MTSIIDSMKRFASTLLGDRTAAPAPVGFQEQTDRPEGGEVGWAEGMFFGQVPLERWNPDELLNRQGQSIYHRMLLDDQVRALLNLKRSVISSRNWSFRFNPADRNMARCADFFRFMLEKKLNGSFRQALEAILSSQAFGFSLVEKVYQPMDYRGRTYWGLSALKLRPAGTFSFDTDRHGNATGLLQQQNGRPVRLDPTRFIHHVNKPEKDPQYGESDLRECYRHWWSKEHILKFWNIYLERMAAGFVHGRISGPLSAAEREELKQVMRRLNSQTSVITPANVELKMISAQSTDAFEKAVASRDKAIAKALLVPNLLGFSEQGQTGSYSQSKTQQETFFLLMNSLAESCADTLNEQLFRELARWNFGLEEGPLFVFDPLSESQKMEYARAWQQALEQGAVNPTAQDEEHLRRLLGFPGRETHQSSPTRNRQP